MYLSKETVTQKEKSAKRQLLVAGIFVIAGLYGIVTSLMGNVELRQYLLTYVILVVIFFLPFLLGVFNWKQIRLTYRLDKTLAANDTDRIPLGVLAQQLRLPEKKILTEVEAILKQGYLVNWVLDRSEEPALRATTEKEPVEGADLG